MNRLALFLSACLFFFVSQLSLAIEIIPDYYEQAGPNPYSSAVDQGANESIDPFSGQLSLSYTDIFLPGNGGMDISVARTYTSLQRDVEFWDRLSFLGSGWQMHMGRLITRTLVPFCTHHIGALDSSLNNPVYELPSGARKMFFDATPASHYWISKDRWKGDCETVGDKTIYILTAPNGYRYTMDYRRDIDVEGLSVYYVTKIEDLNGNYIDITYLPGGTVKGLALISEIRGFDAGSSNDDGRLVRFAYENPNGGTPLLTSIEADGKSWQYVHETIPGVAYDKHLTSVIRPDDTSYDYTYYDNSPNYGKRALKTANSAFGVTTEYTYKSMDFDAGFPGTLNTVVASKRTSGRGVADGSWYYDYTVSEEHDETTVTSPSGTYRYRNVGIMRARKLNVLYAIGLPLQERVYDANDKVVKETNNQWAPQEISHENYFRSSRFGETALQTSAPLLLGTETVLDGNIYTTSFVPDGQDYLSYFDKFGNPLQQEEAGSYYKKTSFTYHHNTYGENLWLVNTVKDMVIHNAGNDSQNDTLVDHATVQTFDTNGRLETATVNGVNTTFTYHLTGDLHTATDALGFTTTYLDYFRGTPRSEARQVSETKSVYRSRVLNDTGTVRSETDEVLRTKQYTYDELNRLASITLPSGSPVTISYAKNYRKLLSKTLSRGSLRIEETFNGVGSVTCTNYTDLATGEQLQKKTDYNALNQAVFSSYISRTGCLKFGDGITHEYDVVGRLRKTTFPDGAQRKTEYTTPFTIEKTDERGFKTTAVMQVFAEPSSAIPVYIEGPEQTRTVIARDLLGNQLSVWQGNQRGIGEQSSYFYDSRFHLVEQFNPEMGSTKYYERDALGQLLNWRVELGSQRKNGAAYSYDGLGRVTMVDLNDNSSVDEAYQYYDDSSLKRASRLAVSRAYTYDENGNVDAVIIDTDSVNRFTLDYDYNELDYLSSITYPSGRVVDYVPDSFGRATQVGDYVDHVSYDANGQLDSYTYRNGAQTYYSYNAERRFLDTISVNANTSVVDKQYHHDIAGNILAIDDLLTDANSLALARYDGLGRLNIAVGAWGEASYEYDYNGNIISSVVGDFKRDFNYWEGRKLASYKENGAATNFYYDIFGNVTRYSGARDIRLNRHSDSLVHTLIKDGTTQTNFYDTEKRRAKKDDSVLPLHYIWGEDDALLASFHASDMYEEHIYLGRNRVATAEKNMRPKVELPATINALELTEIAIEADVTGISNAISPSYAWSQISGPGIALVNADTTTVIVDLPARSEGSKVVLEFKMATPFGDIRKRVEIDISYTDTDEDQLSDQFELRYFGNLSAAPGSDADGDGFSNFAEFENGTDPTVAQAPKTVTGLTADVGTDQVKLSWNNSERATSYNLYWSFSPITSISAANKITGVYPGYVHEGLEARTIFYRVTAANTVESIPSDELTAFPSIGSWTNISSALSGFDVENILAVDSPAPNHYGVIFNTNRNQIAPPTRGYVTSAILNNADYVSLSELLIRYGTGFGSDGSCNMVYAPTSNLPGALTTDLGSTLQLDVDRTQCSTSDINEFGTSLGSNGTIGYTPQTILGDSHVYFVEYSNTTGWATPKYLGSGNYGIDAKLSYGGTNEALIGVRYADSDLLDIFYSDNDGTVTREMTLNNKSIGNDFISHDPNAFDLSLDANGEGAVLWFGPDEANPYGDGVFLHELEASGTWSERLNLRPSDVNLHTVIHAQIHKTGAEGVLSFSGCSNWGADCAQHLTYKQGALGWVTPLERSMNQSANEGNYADDFVDFCGYSSNFNNKMFVCNKPAYDWYITYAPSSYARSFDSLASHLAFSASEDQIMLSDGSIIQEPPRSDAVLLGQNYALLHGYEELSLFTNSSDAIVTDDGYGYLKRGYAAIGANGQALVATAENEQIIVKQFQPMSSELGLSIEVENHVIAVSNSTFTISATASETAPIVWSQVSGPTVSFTDLGEGAVQIDAPNVSKVENLVFIVQAGSGVNQVQKEVTVLVEPATLPIPRLTCRDNCYIVSPEHSESPSHQALSYTSTTTITGSQYGDRHSRYEELVGSPEELVITDASGIEASLTTAEPLIFPAHDPGGEDIKSIRVFASKRQRIYPGESIDLHPVVTQSSDFDVDTRWDQVKGVPVSQTSLAENGLQVSVPANAEPQTLRFRFKAKAASTAEQIEWLSEVRGGYGHFLRPLHYDFVDVEVIEPATGPIAYAGPNVSVDEGTAHTLSALGSRSATNSSLTYSWEQIEGPSVDMDVTSGPTVTFVVPEVETYEILRFRLTVSDEQGRIDQDTATVTAQYKNAPPVVKLYSTLEIYEGELFDIFLAAPEDEVAVFYDGYDYGLAQISGPQAIRRSCVFNGCQNGRTYEAPEVDSAQAMVFERRAYDTRGLEAVEQITVYVLDEADPSMFEDEDRDADGIPDAFDPNPSNGDVYWKFTEYQAQQVATGNPNAPHAWQFTINGTSGNDYVNATSNDPNATELFVWTQDGNDIINLRQGEIVYGGAGDDTFVISNDYAGEARIIGDVRSGYDVLKFAENSMVDNIAFFVRSNRHLLITFDLNGEPNSIRIDKFFKSKTARAIGKGIDAMVLPDGEVITADEIALLLEPYVKVKTNGKINYQGHQGAETVTGTDKNDLLSTYDGDDLITGGKGRDVLRGGTGSDTYFYAPGDGKDKIQNWDVEAESSTDTLQLGHTEQDIQAVWLVREGNSLRVYILGTADQVLLTNWFKGASWKIDKIKLGAFTLNQAGIDILTDEMTALGTPVNGSISLLDAQRDTITAQVNATWVAE